MALSQKGALPEWPINLLPTWLKVMVCTLYSALITGLSKFYYYYGSYSNPITHAVGKEEFSSTFHSSFPGPFAKGVDPEFFFWLWCALL